MKAAWIDNRSREGGGEPVELLEPFSGRPFESYRQATVEDLDDAVRSARVAFERSGWRDAAPLERARVLNRIAEALLARAEEIGELEARNVGRPLAETRNNAKLAADAFAWFAAQTTSLRGASIPMGPGLLDYTVREPLGVCGLIAPWNNPLVLTSWKIGAALAAGNAVVVKPASLTPVSVMRLVELAAEAGLPDGQLNVLAGAGGTLGDRLVSHPEVAKISFTGSTAVGKHVLKLASESLTRVTLELGGKSPAIVFDDADLDLALAGSIPAMFGNAGQMCTARSRLLVQSGIADRFAERLAERIAAMRIGSPFEDGVQLGPVISAGQRETVTGFIDRAAAAGATIVTGGSEAPAGLEEGYFVQPTLIADVDDSMEAVREEIFGPVLVIDRFDEEVEAIERANRSIYGLSATIWTRDLARAHRVAARLEAGTVTVNTMKVSHVYAPFGGYKESGIGRELGSEGLDAFLETKNVIVSIPDS